MTNLFKSLAAFQQEVPVIHKGTQGYGYSYADLPTIFEVINPLMKKHGLGFYQALDGEHLTTVIFHVESGETISGEAKIPQDVELKGMNAFQVMGSAITYFRRYQISAMLGLITDVDNDAAGQQVSKSSSTSKQQTSSINELPWLNENDPKYSKVEEYVAKNGWEKAKDRVMSQYRINKKIQQHFAELSV